MSASKEVMKTTIRPATEVLSPVFTAFVEAVVDFVEVLLVLEVGFDTLEVVFDSTGVVFSTAFLAC